MVFLLIVFHLSLHCALNSAADLALLVIGELRTLCLCGLPQNILEPYIQPASQPFLRRLIIRLS